MSVPSLAIGSDIWPGGAKLIEELGEVGQVMGRLVAFPDVIDTNHPDGSNLLIRMQEELGDLMAAISFFVESNPVIDQQAINSRCLEKLIRFRGWHDDVANIYNSTIATQRAHEEGRAKMTIREEPTAAERGLLEQELPKLHESIKGLPDWEFYSAIGDGFLGCVNWAKHMEQEWDVPYSVALTYAQEHKEM